VAEIGGSFMMPSTITINDDMDKDYGEDKVVDGALDNLAIEETNGQTESDRIRQ
jgi:hypothetical protein